MIRRNRRIDIGLVLLAVLAALAILAPLIVTDPFAIDPVSRLEPPGTDAWFGTDNLGRSILSRTIYGGRISLVVGLAVAAISVVLGLAVGLVAGYQRRFDNALMRVMDGIMSIPSVLLAIALVSVTGAGVGPVIFAITLPEVPRVVRLVRSMVLTVRELPFIEAAVASGSTATRILLAHILPNTMAPLIVQATYVAASAILTEAVLSFLGIGVPSTIPTWGNMIATGRTYFVTAPWMVLCPGLAISIAVLAINVLGDGLRDRLDPRLAYRPN